MIKHLTEQQLIDYIYRTLTDDRRAEIGQHLADCAACRAQLATHQMVERRVHYSITMRRNEMPPHSAYSAIAPRVKRPGPAARTREQLTRFSSGALAVTALALLVMVLISTFGGVRQATINAQPTPTVTPPVTETPTPTATPSARRQWAIGGDTDQLVGPSGLALDPQGNLYVIDAGNDRIVKYDSEGKQLMRWGSHGQGDGQFFFGGVQEPPGSGPFLQSYGKIAVDQQGNIYVADTNNARIQKFDTQGKFLLKWGSPGAGEGQFGFLAGIAIDNLGNIYTAENAPESRIQKFDRNGTFLLQWKTHPTDSGLPFSPDDIAIDQRGYIYLLDRGSGSIQRASAVGQWIDNWPLICGQKTVILTPDSLAIDQANQVYVTDSGAIRICKYNSAGQFLTQWDRDSGGAPSSLKAGNMNGIAVDAKKNVYISVSEANRVVKFSQP